MSGWFGEFGKERRNQKQNDLWTFGCQLNYLKSKDLSRYGVTSVSRVRTNTSWRFAASRWQKKKLNETSKWVIQVLRVRTNKRINNKKKSYETLHSDVSEFGKSSKDCTNRTIDVWIIKRGKAEGLPRLVGSGKNKRTRILGGLFPYAIQKQI